jgi:hypothetical protein
LVGLTPAAYRRRFRTSDEIAFKPVDHARPGLASLGPRPAYPSDPRIGAPAVQAPASQPLRRHILA